MKTQNSRLSKKSETPSKRSTMDHLTVLHSLFNIENPESTCSYATTNRATSPSQVSTSSHPVTVRFVRTVP